MTHPAQPIGQPHSQHQATVRWQLKDGEQFQRGQYNRGHHWSFDNGQTWLASASPHVVRAPFSDPAGVDPEEAFCAAVASCHMLTFLYLACKAGYTVLSYEDPAVAQLGRLANGRVGIQEVVLHPNILWQDPQPQPEIVEQLHHAAHAECYIANSVSCVIRWEAQPGIT